MIVSPSSTSPVALSVATAWQRAGFSLSSNTKRRGEKRPLAFTVAIRNLLLQVGRPWIGVMFCITTSGERRMRLAISKAIRLLARPCCPWYSLGTRVEEHRALAMRWAASKAAMPLNTCRVSLLAARAEPEGEEEEGAGAPAVRVELLIRRDQWNPDQSLRVREC